MEEAAAQSGCVVPEQAAPYAAHSFCTPHNIHITIAMSDREEQTNRDHYDYGSLSEKRQSQFLARHVYSEVF